MKLVIFGATGKTGRELVKQALAQGHEVRAFARHPGALEAQNATASPGKLDVVRGDVRDPGAVKKAIAGQDAVLVALGPRTLSPDDTCSLGTRYVVDGMVEGKVRRLVCMTSIGTGDSKRQMGPLVRLLVAGVVLRNPLADKEKQENIVRTSGLDWVIVRPGSLVDGPRTDRYRIGLGPALRTKRVARADVAAFMLRETTDATYLRSTPSIVGPA